MDMYILIKDQKFESHMFFLLINLIIMVLFD
jgi:hypothetical protein